uniref:ras-related protein Rab-31 n=1 Tax=Ictidomys tridecemlineatus TaxID=43179 RepID=UPI001A9D0B2F
TSGVAVWVSCVPGCLLQSRPKCQELEAIQPQGSKDLAGKPGLQRHGHRRREVEHRVPVRAGPLRPQHQPHHRFHSLAPMYYRGSAAAVIVYDITKQDSFHTLKKWVKELKEHGPERIVVAIAGNKCDLSDIREVPLKDAKEYAESIGAIVVETSAKNAINIEELFQGISKYLKPCFQPSWCLVLEEPGSTV